MTKALCCCSDVNGIIGGGLPKDIQIVMLSNGGHGGREWDNQRVHQVESRKANMTYHDHMVRYWAGLLLRSWGSMGHARHKSSWTRDGHKHRMAQTLLDSIPHEGCWQLLLYCKHSSKIRQTDLLKAFPSISLFNLKGAASDSPSSTEWLKLHRAVLVKTFSGPSQLNHPVDPNQDTI